jgi:hypothetical protein
MTHHSKLVRLRPSTIAHPRVGAAATETATARTSTSLAFSMMVALRYLDGRATRAASAPSDALPDPVAS